MVGYLIQKKYQTITLINSIKNNSFAEDISSVFDDVAGKLQSDEFIESIE